VNISGATGSTYTSSTLANGDVITVVMTSTATCATGSPATSNPITMIVNASLPASVSIAALPAGAICAGTSVTFTATPVNGGTPGYQWKKGGADISGATGSTYTSSTLVNGDIITVVMTSTATCATGSPATSNAIPMVVNASLPASVSIAASPSGAICAGTSVTFTATPVNGGTPGYQWKKGGADISGATGSTYTSSTLLNGDIITVVMTSSATCATGSPATSNAIPMVVNPGLPASVSIAASPAGAICTGTSVTFTATPVNGGTPSYQWKKGGSDISGATGSTYTSSTLANGDIITVVMTSTATCATGSPATSNPITMIVNASLPASVSIAALPAGAICAGTSVTFTATPVNGGTPGYQWKKGGADISGATGSTYTSSTLVNGDIITVVMTSTATCATGSPATSNAIPMVVNASLPASVSIAASPSGAICAGTSVTFTATPVNGGTPGYQWKKGGADISGATGSTYTSSTLLNGDIITVVMTSSATCATGSPATSNAIPMVVNPGLPASVSIAASPAGAICTGTSVTFTATPVNGGTPGYQWKKGGVDIPGETGSTYTSSTLLNGDIISVVMTSTATCATGSPATSNPITMIVNASLPASVSIAALPAGSICVGTSVTFTATPVNGGTPSYQWKKGGADISGETGSTYTSSTLVNGDIITVVMTSSAACATGSPATSNPITITVSQIVGTPSIPTPSASTICQGSANTAYTTSATDATSYNWTVTGTGNTISGTGPTGTVTWAAGFSGIATVSVTANGCNGPSAATSTTVTVRPAPTASISGTATVCQNGTPPNITFTNPQVLPVIITYNINGANQTTIPVDGSSSATVAVPTSTVGIFAYNLVSVVYQTAPACSVSITGTATVTVSALPIPTLTSSDADNIICLGTSVTFTAGGGTSYNFRVAGVSVQSGTSATYITNSLSNGQVVDVVVTNANGCTAISPGIVNFVNPLPFILITTPPTCSTDLTTYSLVVAVSSGTVTSSSGTLISLGSNLWSVTDVVSGVNVNITVTDAVGCQAVLNVTAPDCSCPTILPPVSGGDKSYCESGIIPTISATVLTGETVDWYNSSSGGTLLMGGSLTYTPTAAGTYYAMARNTATGCVSSTRTPITVTMNPLPTPTLTSSDLDNIFCAGTSVTFTAGGGISYNFRVGGVSVQNGTSSTYITSSLINGQVVDVIVTNSIGCSATSAGITNTVNALPAPVLTSSDPDNTFCAGASVTFTSGGGTNYNFRVGGASVQNGSSATYTTNTLTNGQVVDVVITNANGCSVTSPGITNTIYEVPSPTLTSSDADNIFCAGTSVTFTTGGGSNYNFRIGGVSVQSGPLSTFTTSSLTNGQIVDVVVTSAGGCMATSAGITNTVNPLPVPTLTSSDANNKFCTGTSITFTAGGGTNYNFRVGGVSVQNGASATYTTNSLINGQTVDVIVTNANGCTATSAGITNTVDVLPSPTLISTDPDNIFCSGTSITFIAGGGTTYNFRVDGVSVQSGTSSTYTTSTLTSGQVVDVIVTNANGCTATSDGITNTVNELPVPTLTSSDSDNTFCIGTIVIFTAGGGTNYNFRVGGVSVQNGSSTSYITGSLANGQVVDVIVTGVNGCAAVSAGITNTVHPLPKADAGSGGNECDLDFVFKAAPTIGTGTWSLTSGPGTATFAPDANSPTATVTVTEYGTYTFTWTEVIGTCSNSNTITVNFYMQPVANAGTGGNNCGLAFILSGSLNIGTGTWSKVSGPGNASFSPNAMMPNAIVSVTAFGTYTFRWTVVNGTCSNSSTVTVIFIQQPPANAGTGGDECDLDFNLNAISTIGTGTWSKFSGPGNATFTPDNHQPDATVTVDKFGTYDFTWTVVNSTCSSSAVVKVVFHDLPSIKAGNDTAICKGNSIQFHAEGLGLFAWEPGELLSDSTLKDPYTAPDITTTYTVHLTDQFGCKNSDEIVVEIREKPVADAGPDQILEYQFSTNMEAELDWDYENGIWSVISGTGKFLDDTYGGTSVSNLSQEANKFLWTVTNGACPPSLDTVIVKVNDLVIPTLITPNMDGRNDYFVLRGLATLGKTELIIFNRRGAQVYKNLSYDNSWNGVDYNDNPLPDDTYFYVIKTGNGKSISGYIVIRR
jgi:gliding motility-associated-like protein